MLGNMEKSSSDQSPMRGKVGRAIQSLSTPTQDESPALPNTSSLQTTAGDRLESLRRVTRCTRCGAKMRGTSTLCMACRKETAASVDTGTTCGGCGERKRGRSATCLACYRRGMPERNKRLAPAMAAARERNGWASGRKSRPALAAAELFDALGLTYEAEHASPCGAFDFRVGDLLVEVNGRYWHTLPTQVPRDERKAAWARDASLELLVLWDDQQHLWALQLCAALPAARISLSTI